MASPDKADNGGLCNFIERQGRPVYVIHLWGADYFPEKVEK